MIDDEDEKVRRNLVVLSTTVLASAFFGVGIKDIICQLLPSLAIELDEWRIIAAGFALNAYFVVRYRWSKPFEKEISNLSSKINKSIIRNVKKFASCAFQRRELGRSAWIDGQFVDFASVEKEVRQLSDNLTYKLPDGAVTSYGYGLGNSSNPWMLPLACSPRPELEINDKLTAHAHWVVPWYLRPYFFVKSGMPFFYSHEAISMVIPLALSFAALAVWWYKLLIAYGLVFAV